jgi:hypothetical protein
LRPAAFHTYPIRKLFFRGIQKMHTALILKGERMVNFIWHEERMAHCGLPRNYRFSDSSEAAEDIRGAKLYGLDEEKLAKIEDVIFDHSTGLNR